MSAQTATLITSCPCISSDACSDDDRALVRDVVQQLQAIGYSVQGENYPAAALATSEVDPPARADLYVAIGGDGTVNMAAGLAVRNRATLAIIPNGTANLVARDLNIPVDAGKAVEQLADFEAQAIDVAWANDQLFLLAFAVGLVPTVMDMREAIREGTLPETANTVLNFDSITEKTDTGLLTCSASGASGLQIQSENLIITNNEYSRKGFRLYDRKSRQKQELHIVAHPTQHALSRLWFLLRFFTKSDRLKEKIHVTSSPITVSGAASEMTANIDGENLRFSVPVTVKVESRALQVLCPPETVSD